MSWITLSLSLSGWRGERLCPAILLVPYYLVMHSSGKRYQMNSDKLMSLDIKTKHQTVKRQRTQMMRSVHGKCRITPQGVPSSLLCIIPMPRGEPHLAENASGIGDRLPSNKRGHKGKRDLVVMRFADVTDDQQQRSKQNVDSSLFSQSRQVLLTASERYQTSVY
jgi:hypothetical protein